MNQHPQQAFFQFSRREKNGIIAIILFIIMLLAAPYFYLFIVRNDPPGFEASISGLDALADSIEAGTIRPDAGDEPTLRNNYRTAIDEKLKPVAHYFPFDPNTLDSAGWLSLGMPARTTHTILHYRNRGGRFYKADDLDKIWGMPSGMAETLKPYVRMAQTAKPSAYLEKAWDKKEKKKDQPWQKPVDINLADSALWESLPGIGPSLARRIVLFREKLGGFYEIAQVSETFGLPDSVYRKILGRLIMGSADLRKLGLNTASTDIMKNHPYIRYRLANALDAYRKQHGPYRSVSDIRKLMIMTDSLYNKLAPYLMVD